MLSDYLKVNTKKDHDSIEEKVDLVKLATEKQTYIQLLKDMYSFYAPLENNLAHFKDDFQELNIDLKERLKISLLKKDLLHFELDESVLGNLDICESYPKAHNIKEAMGILYVLEGSTMGGQIIFKNLQKAGIITGESGGEFFKPYGSQTMPMWMSFKDSLNKLPEEDAVVLEKAKETFHSMEAWLSR